MKKLLALTFAVCFSYVAIAQAPLAGCYRYEASQINVDKGFLWLRPNNTFILSFSDVEQHHIEYDAGVYQLIDNDIVIYLKSKLVKLSVGMGEPTTLHMQKDRFVLVSNKGTCIIQAPK